MRYKWAPHRQTLYRLYVEENRSLDEVAEYMREHHDFTPSRRAFQHMFSCWRFPNKLNPAYKNEQLVARVRQLWELGMTQKNMVATLVAEGFQVGDREVGQIRSKNRWLLSSNGGYGQPTLPTRRWKPRGASHDGRAGEAEAEDGDGTEVEHDDGDGDETEVEQDGEDGDETEVEQDGDEEDHEGEQDVEDAQDDGPNLGQGYQGGHEADATGDPGHSTFFDYGPSLLSPVDAQVHDETLAAMREARREYRKRLYEAEAQERWLAKKRRRHTRPYAGLPPDPPGPPRFPSETTLTEAKQILQLDQASYMALREHFQTICVNAGVYKKTLAGPERWEELKNQLVRESMHLRTVMWDPTDMDKKKLAIEIIACDVTKRIRDGTKAVRVREAAVILGLNPEQSRLLRGQLYNILALENFTSKREEGLEYFEALKQRWIEGSEVLSRIVAARPSDPGFERKMKAVNVLGRDATSRYRVDMFKLGKTPAILLPPELQKPPPPPPPPKPARKQATPKGRFKGASKMATQAAPSAPSPAHEAATASEPRAVDILGTPPQLRRPGRPKGSRNKQKPLPHTLSRLVLAGSSPPPADRQAVGAQHGADTSAASGSQPPLLGGGQYRQAPTSAPVSAPAGQGFPQGQAASTPVLEPTPASSGAMAVFFRLHTSSAMMFPGVQAQWIGTLGARTMAELKNAFQQKVPGALCYRFEGIVKDGRGGELPLPVSDDGELETYLQHVQHHGAPTFDVSAVPGVG